MPLTFAVGLATTGFAFMAANTVPATNAGTAESAISGYTVSKVHYSLTTTGDPEDVTAVGFHLQADNPPTGGAPAPTVAIELKNDAGRYSCMQTPTNSWNSSTGSGDFTCSLSPALDVKNLVELTVVAAQ